MRAVLYLINRDKKNSTHYCIIEKNELECVSHYSIICVIFQNGIQLNNEIDLI